MTKDEKKHFILQHLALDDFKVLSANSSQLALCVTPNLDNSEVYMLCREMEYDVPLKIYRHKDSGDTLDVLQTCEAVNAFKTGKYLFLGSIDNIEFEILNYLKDKSTTEQTRINHILVKSNLTVFNTNRQLNNMVTEELIQITPPPLSLTNDSNNKLIDNHVLAFENLHRPIKANITFKGKTYFKEQYMSDNKPQQQFNGPVNYIAGDNHGKQTLFTTQTNKDHKQDKKTLMHKIWYLISENKLVTGVILIIVAAIVSSISKTQNQPKVQKDNINTSDTTVHTR